MEFDVISQVKWITNNNNGTSRRRADRDMSQAVSHRTLTAETRVQARGRPWGNCVGKSSKKAGFPQEFFGFILSISFHRCSPYSYIDGGMNNRQVGGRSSETEHMDRNNNNRGNHPHISWSPNTNSNMAALRTATVAQQHLDNCQTLTGSFWTTKRQDGKLDREQVSKGTVWRWQPSGRLRRVVSNYNIPHCSHLRTRLRENLVSKRTVQSLKKIIWQ
jgi:hypothetical protein